MLAAVPSCGVIRAVMCPACLQAAGRARTERWKFLHSPSSATRDPGPPMTSSSMTAARSQYLLELLDQVPDPRKRRGRRHPLAGLLGEVFCHLRHRCVEPGQSRAAQAARRRRRPRGRRPPPPFLDPSRDRLRGQRWRDGTAARRIGPAAHQVDPPMCPPGSRPPRPAGGPGRWRARGARPPRWPPR